MQHRRSVKSICLADVFFCFFFKVYNFKECASFGGKCIVTLDAYFFQTAICVVIGIIWIIWKKNTINGLQHLAKSCWKIPDSVVRKIVSN